MSDSRPLTLGDRFDIAEGLAKQNKSIEDIARGAGVTLETAKLFWSRHHPGDFQNVSGLKRTTVNHAPWLIETMKLLASIKEGGDE